MTLERVSPSLVLSHNLHLALNSNVTQNVLYSSMFFFYGNEMRYLSHHLWCVVAAVNVTLLMLSPISKWNFRSISWKTQKVRQDIKRIFSESDKKEQLDVMTSKKWWCKIELLWKMVLFVGLWLNN